MGFAGAGEEPSADEAERVAAGRQRLQAATAKNAFARILEKAAASAARRGKDEELG